MPEQTEREGRQVESHLRDFREVESTLLDNAILLQPWMEKERRSFEKCFLDLQDAQETFLNQSSLSSHLSDDLIRKNFQGFNQGVEESVHAGRGFQNFPLGRLLSAIEASAEALQYIAQFGRMPEVLIKIVNSWTVLEQWALQHLENQFRSHDSFNFPKFRIEVEARLRTMAKAISPAPGMGITTSQMIESILDKVHTAYTLSLQERPVRKREAGNASEMSAIPVPQKFQRMEAGDIEKTKHNLLE